MAYEALALHLLISAPSDIPDEDLATIRRTISQWNVTYGRTFGLTVIPVSWTEHAVSEFGTRPQEVINEQLIDQADLALALFADRLGTPTGTAESGTAEEIRELVQAGKSVSVLRNTQPRSRSTGADAAKELVRLEKFLKDLYKQAIVLTYDSQVELAQHVNNMLSRFTATFQQAKSDARRDPAVGEDPTIGIWPRIEVSDYSETDSRGHLKNRQRWHLVLENLTGMPARNVSYELVYNEDGEFLLANDSKTIQVMAPGAVIRIPMIVTFGSPDEALCRVTWTATDGKEHKTEATVRL